MSPGTDLIRSCPVLQRLSVGTAFGLVIWSFGCGGAHADPTPAITTALDRFQSACATALADPGAYIAALTLPGPSGEAGLYPSEDGQYRLVVTAQSEGLTDLAEFVALPGTEIRRCAVEAVLPGFPDEPEVAAALRPLLEGRAATLIGGETQSESPIWEPENEPAVFEGAPFHMFFFTGLFPDAAIIAQAQTGSGSLSLAVEHRVPTE